MSLAIFAKLVLASKLQRKSSIMHKQTPASAESNMFLSKIYTQKSTESANVRKAHHSHPPTR